LVAYEILTSYDGVFAMNAPTQTSSRADRLYDLIPVVYRLRDANLGYPLKALLHVIAEQVNLLEDDIAQLYENWFIETCQDWVVPYVGALVGYRPLFDLNETGDVLTPQGQARNRILIPRAEVANTIGFRRRKGTVRLLEELAATVAGWPARAVEFYRLLGVTQNIDYLHLDRGRTAELRDGDALDNIGNAFDEFAHSVDVRRVNSPHFPGSPNIPEIGVYLWRLKSYSVTLAPAYCFEAQSPNCFLFSVLGNDTPLFTCPRSTFGHQPSELDLPVPIRRRSFEIQETAEKPGATTSGIPYYYGDGKSLQIWTGSPRQPVPASSIVAADLSDWKYRPLPNQVAVDPALGRIVFPPGQVRKQSVWVSYFYGFSADIGGGEYERLISQPADSVIYRVGENEQLKRINDALATWQASAPQHAVIEITDSGVYVEQIRIQLKSGQTLELRAANRKRPTIRLLDWQTSQPDSLSVAGAPSSWLTLDGLLVTGRGVQIEAGVTGVTIRHSTLVPGWGLECNCEPHRTNDPSLELIDGPDCLTIEHSIVGAIQVDRDEVKQEPVLLRITDSILDATRPDSIALGAPASLCAHAILTLLRSTVFGQLQSRALDLAENSILMGVARICRRQQGCVRFCYVTPGSRTPHRYECQPDLVVQAVNSMFARGDITSQERDTLRQSEQLRVEPEFNSTRYGTPAYCQFADACAAEILRGAEDESEIGVFHDLFQPQRVDALRTRLDEYSPAGMDVGILFAS
jgi:hypothetical protein